jgi:hypothetical protein
VTLTEALGMLVREIAYFPHEAADGRRVSSLPIDLTTTA